MSCRLLSFSSETMWPELLRALAERDNPDHTAESDVRQMIEKVRKEGDAGRSGIYPPL